MKHTTSGDTSLSSKVSRLRGEAYILHAKQLRHADDAGRAKNVARTKALPSTEDAWKAVKKSEQIDYPELVTILGDLSNINEILDDPDQATNFSSQQLELTMEHLPDDHDRRNVYLRRYVRLHNTYGMHNKAMEMAQRIETEQASRFGQMSIHVAKTKLAAGKYTEACRMLFELDPLDEAAIERCLDCLYRRKQADKCVRWFQKWLSYLKEKYPSTEPRIGKALHQLACIYHALGDIRSASTCLQQALSIYVFHNNRLGMRSIEDSRRHFEKKARTFHYIANIVCDDNWENGLIT